MKLNPSLVVFLRKVSINRSTVISIPLLPSKVISTEEMVNEKTNCSIKTHSVQPNSKS